MNTSIAKLQIPTTELDRRAAALADVQQMHEDLRKTLDIIGQQRAELARAADRDAFKTAEINRLRHENHVFRDKCVELATAQSNIGLLCVTANNVMMSVRELTERAGEEAIDEQA